MAHETTSTTTLWGRVLKTHSIRYYVNQNQRHFLATGFAQYINELLIEKGLVRERVIKAADIENAFGHQIFRGARHPSRDKIIQLAFGFPLSVEETQRMLICANKRALHPKIKRDAVIIFCLHNANTLAELQDTLFDLQLPLLGDDAD